MSKNYINSTEINVIIPTSYLNLTTQSLLPFPLTQQHHTSPKNLNSNIHTQTHIIVIPWGLSACICRKCRVECELICFNFIVYKIHWVTQFYWLVLFLDSETWTYDEADHIIDACHIKWTWGVNRIYNNVHQSFFN